MRIGVDATCWGNKRGFGRFTRELMESVVEIDKTNDYLFFIDDKTPEIESIPERVQKIVASTEASQSQAASASGRRSLNDLWAMSREVFRHKIDVFFFPAVYSYFPVFNRTKIIVTLHDVIADHHPNLIFPDSKSKFFWKLKQQAAIRQAKLILTVSEYSKRQIREYFRVSESRLRVINEGARPVFKVLSRNKQMNEVLEQYNLKPDDKFLLYVGGISPHKNLNTLIEAFSQLMENPDRQDIKLILVGDYKDDPFFSAYPSLKKQITQMDLEDNVTFTGFVSDEDLAFLYNAATLLVFPSLEEGFGLPAIEAMSCGTPVAASNCSSLPEVIGNAGKFFDPCDSKNMAQVIEQILDNALERYAMKEKSIDRAEQYTWKKAAASMVEIFDELAT
jgi:glycosyltransferase involved in cell wall biosynthesis